MHHPGHIRDAFVEWVEAGLPAAATVERNYEPQQVPAARLLGMLWQCTDIMPGWVCGELDLPPGCTYAQAAQGLLRDLRSA